MIQKKLDSGTNVRKIIADQVLKEIYQKKSSYWKKLRNKKSLELFHFCSKQVLAYDDFLKTIIKSTNLFCPE